MNKYQKAWSNVYSLSETSDYYKPERDKKDIDLIKELVDKETPKKLNMENMHYICCPNCHSDEVEFYDHDHNVVKLNYCNRCGQALDWSEDE